MSARAEQVGGSHYKDMAIQPVDYIHKNGIGYIEGSVIKYVSRWRSKGGVEDLMKARHFIDLLIEAETVGAIEPQAEHAKDVWMDWDGKRPTGPEGLIGNAPVKVVLRNGRVLEAQPAGAWVWSHNGSNLDIIAYMVI